MLKKLISILLTTSLSLGTFSFLNVQPTEATLSSRRMKAHPTRRYNSKSYRIKRAIRERRYSGQVGVASHYGHNDGYDGKQTASGVRFSKWSSICAHNGFRLGTKLKVTNVKTGKSTTCKVMDTGGFSKLGRALDLSYGSFGKIANPNQGLVRVKIEKIN